MSKPITPDSLRADLENLSSQADDVAQHGARIRREAESRLDVVNARLGELRPKVHADEFAAAEYGELITERGRLHLVLESQGR